MASHLKVCIPSIGFYELAIESLKIRHNVFGERCEFVPTGERGRETTVKSEVCEDMKGPSMRQMERQAPLLSKPVIRVVLLSLSFCVSPTISAPASTLKATFSPSRDIELPK